MNEPHKPKLTDYLTEALAKESDRGGASESPRGARTRGGRGAAGAGWRPSGSRRDLWTLRRLGRKPRRLLRYAPNHGSTRFSRSRYPSGSIQLGRPAGSPSGESSTLTKTCRRTGNCPYSRLRKVLASPCSSSWTATASPPWPKAEARPWNWPSTSARAS